MINAIIIRNTATAEQRKLGEHERMIKTLARMRWDGEGGMAGGSTMGSHSEALMRSSRYFVHCQKFVRLVVV